MTTSREAAQEHVKDDPFYLKGTTREWHARERANTFA